MLKKEDRGKKIYMNCNACGKCCDGEMSLTLNECFQYKDDFIISLLWRLQKDGNWFTGSEESESAKESKLIGKHFENFFYCIQNPQSKIIKDGYSLQIFPYAAGYKKYQNNRKVCSKLNMDNTCSIYEDRPLMCRTLPLQAVWPNDVQWHSLRHFSFYQDCLSTKKEKYGKEIFDKEIITDPYYKDNFEKMSAELEKDFLSIKEFLTSSVADESIGYEIPIKELFKNYENQSYMETSLALIIPFYLNRLDDGHKLINFFESQIKLIKQEVSEALQRKNHEERKYTQHLRSYIEIYTKILEDKIVENIFNI